MADYKYIGMTAYIQEDTTTIEKLMVLAEAVEVFTIPLSKFEQPASDNSEAYQAIKESEAYQYLYDNDAVAYGKWEQQPQNTPEAYNREKIERVTIKGTNFIRLYVPTNAKNEDTLKTFVYESLIPTLSTLFGSALISVKTREGLEYDNFADLNETVVISANKQVTA